MTEVPSPLFTLRGHETGVSALARWRGLDAYLISGDQNGTIIIWSLSTFRRYHCFPDTFQSRIQSLRVVTLGDVGQVLFAQSRDEGIKLLSLNQTTCGGDTLLETRLVASYSTYESLFSRADALDIRRGEAIVVHPSSTDNHLATIRLLDSTGKTAISGTAQRNDGESSKKCSVFDMTLRAHSDDEYLLFIAYEDGCLCIYSVKPNSTITVPELGVTGLKIDLMKKLNFDINDFMSAFDVTPLVNNSHSLVCGSPKDHIIFCGLSSLEDDWRSHSINQVKIRHQGVSSVRIRPDMRLVAVSGWDNAVRLYSMKSRKLLAVLEHHLKQVQDILFIESYVGQNVVASDELYSGDEQLAPDRNDTKYLLCCASMEGTISITAIY